VQILALVAITQVWRRGVFLLLILFNLVDRSGKGFRMKLEAIRVSRNLRGGGKTSFEKEFFLIKFRVPEKECN